MTQSITNAAIRMYRKLRLTLVLNYRCVLNMVVFFHVRRHAAAMASSGTAALLSLLYLQPSRPGHLVVVADTGATMPSTANASPSNLAAVSPAWPPLFQRLGMPPASLHMHAAIKLCCSLLS
jgi:hypothetical protein